MNISLQTFGFDVAPLVAQLAANPQLWNENTLRTESPMSPHREVDDIWCRYQPSDELAMRANEPHDSIWYPCVKHIPDIVDMSECLMRAVGGKKLGGVLITRIPAGKQVYPHIDHGWHARHYEKFAVQLAGNREQAFCFEGESLSAVTGEVYLFRNDVPHWVLNPSLEDRMTAIICVRRD